VQSRNKIVLLVYSVGTGRFTTTFKSITAAVPNGVIYYVDDSYVLNSGSLTGVLATQDLVGGAASAGSITGAKRVVMHINGSVTPVTIASFSARRDAAGVL